ncbi:MAG TPA: hypothetical protein DCE42_26680, partial [Myxococcales bacterium]|nr:hypothetical protein [Myxococcales bacterium]
MSPLHNTEGDKTMSKRSKKKKRLVFSLYPGAEKLQEGTIPREWNVILRKILFYRHLPKDLRHTLHNEMVRLLKRVQFAGKGLKLKNEMYIMVAAAAARISLIHSHHLEGLHKVILTNNRPTFEGIVVSGYATYDGAVWLCWKDADKDLRRHNDGHDLIIHELAHIVDFRDGLAWGDPGCPHIERLVAQYHAVWNTKEPTPDEYAILERLELFKDPYGKTERQEFWAVSVENFFERPHELNFLFPELYAAYVSFFGWDPSQSIPKPSMDTWNALQLLPLDSLPELDETIVLESQIRLPANHIASGWVRPAILVTSLLWLISVGAILLVSLLTGAIWSESMATPHPIKNGKLAITFRDSDGQRHRYCCLPPHSSPTKRTPVWYQKEDGRLEITLKKPTQAALDKYLYGSFLVSIVLFLGALLWPIN